jgi:hypothetical protein
MTWATFDDKFYQHPKVLTAGRDAAWLWAAAIGYCNAHNTDGFVATGALPMLAMDGLKKAEALAQRCVTAKLFDVVNGGYYVHDFLDWNDSAAVVKARRLANAERVKKHMSKRDRNASANASTNALKIIPSSSSSSVPKKEPPTPACGGSLDLIPDDPPKSDPVTEVFEHWRETMGYERTVLDDKRRAVIAKAIKNHGVDKTRDAITGCRATRHNMGHNDRGERYDGLKVILKDADQIERFAARAGLPPVDPPATPSGEPQYADPSHQPFEAA